jgi:hypothetical protein
MSGCAVPVQSGWYGRSWSWDGSLRPFVSVVGGECYRCYGILLNMYYVCFRVFVRTSCLCKYEEVSTMYYLARRPFYSIDLGPRS